MAKINLRAKPLITRTKIQVQIPKAPKIVHKTLTPIQRAQQGVNGSQPPVPAKRATAQSIVVNQSKEIHFSRQKVEKPKKAKVQLVTKNISLESKQRIDKIKGIGKGRILIIIGNGPSINEVQLQDLKHADIDTLSINKPDMRIWPTTYWTFFDTTQFNRNKELWDTYTGISFNSTAIKSQNSKSMQFKNLGHEGFSRDLSKGIYIGRSSVYSSMQIAYWMQYDKIYLFGVDMNPEGINGQLHFYGTNPDVEPRIRATRFEKEAKSYTIASEVLDEAERQKFVFCSAGINPWPFMEKFPSLVHTEAVNFILNNK